MKKRRLFFLLLLVSLTGCSRYTEVNQLGIVEIFSITKEEKNIVERASLVFPKKEEATSDNEYKVIESKGSSLGNAFLGLENKEGKNIYFDQTQILLLDEAILRENGEELIDFLLTNFRHPNLLTFLCKDCERILKMKKEKSFYENFIRAQNKKRGTTAVTTLEDFAALYLDQQMTAYLPVLEAKGETVKLTSFLAFQGKKRTVSYTTEEAKTFFLLKGKIKTIEEQITVKKKKYSFSLSKIRAKIREKQGKINIEVSFKYQENDAINKISKKEIEKQLKQKIKKDIQTFLQKEKLENTDLLGIENLFLRKVRNSKKAQEKRKKATYHIIVTCKKEGGFF